MLTPHLYRARCNPLTDVDSALHMNNAAYFVHCELARYQWAAASGLMAFMVRERALFLVASASMRYRREIRPFQPFHVKSRMVAFNERSVYVLHDFVSPSTDELLARGMCRALMRNARGVLPPMRAVESMGIAPGDAALASLRGESAVVQGFHGMESELDSLR